MAPKQPNGQGVVKWRRLELVGCGFPALLAERVARDERYDLHQLIELVQRGCSPELAVRILSPVEEEGTTPVPMPPS